MWNVVGGCASGQNITSSGTQAWKMIVGAADNGVNILGNGVDGGTRLTVSFDPFTLLSQ